MRGLTLLVFFLIYITNASSAVKVKFSHPRLINIEAIKRNNSKKEILKLLKSEADYYLIEEEEKMIRNKYKERKFIRLYSLLYALEKREKYFTKAKRLITALTKLSLSEDDQQIRTRLQAYAYYYDLCFERLDKKERESVQKQILKCIYWLDKHGYLRTNNFGGGHHHYANISAIIGCLAIYYEEPSAKKWCDILEKNLKEGFIPFYKYLAQEDGSFHMWWEYTRYYIFGELEFYSIWKNATGEDLFKKNQWIEKVFYFLIYGLRDDLTYWNVGDNHARHLKWIDKVIFEKIASEYKNCYAKYMVEIFEKQRKNWPSIDELFFELLWKKEDVKPCSICKLPLVREFKKAGVYIFREGWEGENVIALFKCTPIYFFNHSHRDANSFLIWYKGDLAIDSGYYGKYGSKHWLNYYIRSIAHNTVLIYDPEERFNLWGKSLVNDGGQKFINKPHYQPYNVEDLKAENFKVGETKIIEDNENYTLVVGDATKAYSSKKCKLFRRYFLWLKKVKKWSHPVIVIFDEVISTNPNFEKIWLLHSINKPKIEGNLITIKNGLGKLWCYIIEPNNFKLSLVGGKGREFEVNKINFTPFTIKNKNVDVWSGRWRVELRKNGNSRDTYFLVVLIPAEWYRVRSPKIKKLKEGVCIENWKIVYKNGKLRVLQLNSENE